MTTSLIASMTSTCCAAQAQGGFRERRGFRIVPTAPGPRFRRHRFVAAFLAVVTKVEEDPSVIELRRNLGFFSMKLAMSMTSKLSIGDSMLVLDSDCEKGLVRRNRGPIENAPRSAESLTFLPAQPGRLVSREEIRGAVSKDGVFVRLDRSVNLDTDSPVLGHLEGGTLRLEGRIEKTIRALDLDLWKRCAA